MDPVWLIPAVALGIAAWLVVSSMRKAPAEPAKRKRSDDKASSPPARASKSPPAAAGSGSSKATKKDSGQATPAKKEAAPEGSEKESKKSLPTLQYAEDDDVAFTQITASPATDSARPKSSESDASTIAVIYEDEAAEEEQTKPTARILVHAHGVTDQGMIRRRNEDALLVFPEHALFAVADGMGGHRGGAEASALAIETIKGAFERNVFDAKTESATEVPRRGRELACAIQMANQAVLGRAEREPNLQGMGTTVVSARFSPNKQRMYVGHVGDSRCYRFRGGVLRQLTTDHTLGELGVQGPTAEHLFQAVGVRPKLLIDVIIDKPRAEDVYVLCSDGLSKMVTDKQICDVLARQDEIEPAMYRLLELANDQGGRDNVTIILVRVQERPR